MKIEGNFDNINNPYLNNNFDLDLRNLDKSDKEKSIKKISAQFEEMLLQTLVKSAFENTGSLFEEEGEDFLSSKGFNSLKTMYFSQYIAQNGGLGYQKTIEEQINLKLLRKNKNAQGEELPALTLKERPSSNILKEIKRERMIPHIEDFSLSKKKIVYPLEKPAVLSSNFGWRKDPFNHKKFFHSGVDLAVPLGTEVKSIMDGKVIYSGWKKGYGNIVIIKHADGLSSRYAHNSKLEVELGQEVKAGDLICRSGSTGRSTGPHLHFEVRKNGVPINPSKFLEKKI